MENTNSNKYVLITGCDSGIGEITVHALQEKGYVVFAGVITEEAFQKWEKLKGVIPVYLDITKKSHIDEIVNKFHREKIELYALINNAGISYWGPILAIQEQHIRKNFEVNFFGTYNLTKALFPFYSRKSSRIVMISSLSVTGVFPYSGIYTVTKASVEIFSTLLRRELILNDLSNIKVSIIEPSSIKTPIWENAKKNDRLFFDQSTPFSEQGMKVGLKTIDKEIHNGLPPSLMASTILNILESNRPKEKYYVIKLLDYLIIKTLAILPYSISDYIIKRAIKFYL